MAKKPINHYADNKVGKKPGIHYVDNKKFFTAMLQYKNDLNEALEKGNPKPRIPPYIGECLYKIANHLSYKPNFVNYTFREDMVADGLENCINYLNNLTKDKILKLRIYL